MKVKFWNENEANGVMSIPVLLDEEVNLWSGRQNVSK